MNPLVAIVDSVFDSYEQEKTVLEQINARIDISNPGSERELISRVKHADAVLVNLHSINKTVIEEMDRCRVISRYGVGVDNVHLEAAANRGIWVANVPAYCVEETADHALALLFCCIHGIAFKDRLIRQGHWKLEKRFPLSRTGVCTLGIIGCGRIGRRLHAKAVGLGFREILVYDPYVSAEEIAGLGGRKTALEELLREADFITLHVPLNKETFHLLAAPQFRLMKPHAVLVNTSRGQLIDETALVRALKNERSMSAGLDVYEREPLPDNSPLRMLDNVVLTDHTAYFSSQSIEELKTSAAQNVTQVFLHGSPVSPVNTPYELP